MKKQPWLILCFIALVAGLALAVTNMVTAGPIEQQQIKAAREARSAVFSAATDFEEMIVDESIDLDSVYLAKSGDETIGYVLQTTVSGYGGKIQIIMGIDIEGTVTGVSVGGSDFSETAGLGTKVKEADFTDQFIGLTSAPIAGENVDTISGATISSSAVIEGTTECYEAWLLLTAE